MLPIYTYNRRNVVMKLMPKMKYKDAEEYVLNRRKLFVNISWKGLSEIRVMNL
jgi:hypothetical protein